MLKPEEIQEGMHITVTEWKPRVVVYGGQSTVEVPDRSFVGDVLLVHGVKLPFVRVTKAGDKWKFTIDTREVNVMEIPEDWANSPTKKAVTQ